MAELNLSAARSLPLVSPPA